MREVEALKQECDVEAQACQELAPPFECLVCWVRRACGHDRRAAIASQNELLESAKESAERQPNTAAHETDFEADKTEIYNDLHEQREDAALEQNVSDNRAGLEPKSSPPKTICKTR